MVKLYTTSDHCDICRKESEKNHVSKLKIYNKSKIGQILMWFFKCWLTKEDDKWDHLYFCKSCVIKFNKAMYNREVSKK